MYGVYSKQYKDKVKERNKVLLDHFEKNGDDKAKEIYMSYKKELKEISNKRKAEAIAFSFRGRNSFHFWIFVFGLVTAIFYFSCKSLHDEFSRGSTFKHQFVSLTGIGVSFFWFIHLIFFTQNDFNKHTYFYAIVGCAVLLTVFTFYLVKHFTYKDQAINNLTNLLVRTKEDHYEKVAVKAYYAEKNDKPIISLDTTKQNIEEFDKDVEETITDL